VAGSMLAVFALAGCKSNRCSVDCAAGYEQVPNTCSCHPIADAGTDRSGHDSGTSDAMGDRGPLASCVADSSCGAGSSCVEGCPSSAKPSIGGVGGICSVPGREMCGCGAVLQPCQTPGTACLMPACCDYEGICVNPTERAAICARPEGAHFDCTADAGPGTDASSALCPAPPSVGAGGCGTQPLFNPMASSLKIWIADAAAPQGGWTLNLPFGASAAAGSHTYAYKTGSLSTTGDNGVVGDAFIDVDGKVNQIHFQYEGCAIAGTQGTWDWTPALTISSMTCLGCADVHVGRHFVISESTVDGGSTTTFTADQPPRGCGDGIDLLQMVM